MKNSFLKSIILFIILFVSCRKQDDVQTSLPIQQPVVETEYINLDNREVRLNLPPEVLDVNKDGAYDLIFGVLLVGDPINKVDKSQFNVTSSFYTSLPVNVDEQIVAMKKSDVIPLNNFNGNNWYNASGVMLIEKNEFSTGAILWQGNWLSTFKKYLPFQVVKDGRRFNGWVELTDDHKNNRLILHRAAISKEPETEMRAGH